jgi:ribonuclease PH
MRAFNRPNQSLRPVKITAGIQRWREGSVLVEFGDTKVICAASIDQKVPPFLAGRGSGWVTAEYSMLPGSTLTRTGRERTGPSGRTHEIQRLIGRSLRAVTDLRAFPDRTIQMDCDVLQADGGTRTAAITGSCVALALALGHLKKCGAISAEPMTGRVAAVSAGIVRGEPLLDLDYEEDSTAEVDMNVVMTDAGKFVEIQGTAEHAPFGRAELDRLLLMSEEGIRELFKIQQAALAG